MLYWPENKQVTLKLSTDLKHKVKLFVILSDQYCSSKQDSKQGQNRIAVFEDWKATALISQPTWLDENYISDSQP